MRRAVTLATVVVLAVVGLVPAGSALEPTIIELETVASGLTAPLGVTHALVMALGACSLLSRRARSVSSRTGLCCRRPISTSPGGSRC